MAKVMATLRDQGAMAYTVAAGQDPLQYISPYGATPMAE
ncbi:MAG: hypothetical protein RLZZ597_1533 [Cyanobacteriota bacterium]|jgi:hypothetical protein